MRTVTANVAGDLALTGRCVCPEAGRSKPSTISATYVRAHGKFQGMSSFGIGVGGR